MNAMTQTPARSRKPVPQPQKGQYRYSLVIYKTTPERFSSRYGGADRFITYPEAVAMLRRVAANHPRHFVDIVLTVPKSMTLDPLYPVARVTTLTAHPEKAGATRLEGVELTVSNHAHSARHSDPAKRGTHGPDEAQTFSYDCLFDKPNGNHRGSLKGAAGKVAAYAKARGVEGRVSVAVIVGVGDWGEDGQGHIGRKTGLRLRHLHVWDNGKSFALI